MPFLSTPMTLSATGSIVGSAWISGGISALSFCAIPAILQSNAPTDGLVRAWYTQFSHALYIPSTAVITALNYFYLAYRHRSIDREWRGYAGGGVANLLLVPFTLIFIGGINNTLIGSRKHLAPNPIMIIKEGFFPFSQNSSPCSQIPRNIFRYINANCFSVEVSSAQGRKILSLDTARQLIGRWGNLNFYRIFMPLAGAVLGLWNLLSE